MKKEYFIYKSYVEFAITSDEVSPSIITNSLNIMPKRHHKKGDIYVSKNSGSKISRYTNLWAIETEYSEMKEETVSHHIEYFKSIFFSKMDILECYKEDSRFDVTFWIWIETDNAGIGLDLSEEELSFLNSISNRVHFSIICNKETKEV